MTSVSAHEILVVRDCVAPGCDLEALPGGDRCGRHPAVAPAAPDRTLWGQSAPRRGRKRRTAPRPSPDRVVADVQRWARENGRFPRSTDFQMPQPGFPSYEDVRYAFPGGWRAALLAAGFPPIKADPDRSFYDRVTVTSGGVVLLDGRPADHLPEPAEAEDPPAALETVVALETVEDSSEVAAIRQLLGADPAMLRGEAERLRRVADALDVIAGGVDDLRAAAVPPR